MVFVRGKEIDSPVGRLYICAIDGHLCYVHYVEQFEARKQVEERLKKWVPSYQFSDDRCSCLVEAEKQIAAYFRGELRTFDLPLRMLGTDFQKEVWRALQTIPFGQTYTYRQIAEKVGRPNAVRAVGGANNRNPLAIIVPCHRVIGTNGQLVGYRGGLHRKELLLAHEKKVMT